MSLLLLLGGEGVAEAPTPSRIAVQQEFPPDDLAVRITPPGGSPSRWAADEPLAENVIDGLEFGDEMPGGEKDARGTLARDPRSPWPDLVPFSEVEIYGPGVENVWEGRFGKDSSIEGDSTSIAVEMEGNSAELEDNKALKLGFINSDASAWSGVSNRRREQLLPLKWTLGDAEVASNPVSGLPGLRFTISESWQVQVLAEAHFDAGSGIKIGGILWSRTSSTSNTSTEPKGPNANFVFAVGVSADDLAAAFEGSGDLHTAEGDGDPAGSMYTPATPRRFGLMLWYYLTPGGATGLEWTSFVNHPIVVGDHGLPLQGTFPEVGFTAKQMLGYAIAQHTGLEFDEESEDDSFIIPHAWWQDYTTLAAVVQELTRYGLLDWMVFGKKFSLRLPGTYGRKWKLYSGPSELQEDGVDSARSWRKITVAWPDVDGSTRTAGPLGSGADYETAALEITDPDHPAVRANKDRQDVLVLKDVGNQKNAVGAGERWLVEANELSHAGSCSASGYAQNDKGIWLPVSQIRGGDDVSFADSGDPSYRKVTSRVYSHPDRRASLSLDAPPEGLQALLERYDAELVSLGAS